MLPNNGILFKGVLKHKLLNNPSPSYSFINFDFLLPHAAHFDDNIALLFLVFNNFNLHSLYLFYILNNIST